MQTKKLNETKIYDNLTHLEKARLLFKAMSNRDDATFDKLLSSGESKRWVVRNHESREVLTSMIDVSLCWGVSYWKNKFIHASTIPLATMIQESEKNYKEVTSSLMICELTNDAYINIIDRLEDDYGMDRKTLLELADLDSEPPLLADKENGADQEIIGVIEKKLYPLYTRLVDKALSTIEE